jgi:hypothetical protein
VARKIAPVGRHDGRYSPRRIQVAGDIDIRALGRDQYGALWGVSIAPGCLRTRDAERRFRSRRDRRSEGKPWAGALDGTRHLPSEEDVQLAPWS